MKCYIVAAGAFEWSTFKKHNVHVLYSYFSIRPGKIGYKPQDARGFRDGCKDYAIVQGLQLPKEKTSKIKSKSKKQKQ